MRSTFTIFFFMFIAAVFAAEAGFTDYIVGITGADKIQRAKTDIEQAGGKVLHEITLGFNGLVVSLPSDQLQAFDAKDYIDFMEEDKAVHAL